MSESITAEMLSEGMRKVGTKYSISGTVQTKEGTRYDGEGTLSRTRDSFALFITFPPGREPPKLQTGTFTPDDCWTFEGVIGIDLRFTVERLAPWGSTHFKNGITTREFDTHTLALSPRGCSALPIRQVTAMLDAAQTAVDTNGGALPPDFDCEIPPLKPLVASSEKQPPSPYSDGIWIHALILDFPLIHTNGGTDIVKTNDFLGVSKQSTSDTFSGNFDQVEFGLIRRNEDLNVYLFLPQLTAEETPLESHEQFLTAFLHSLAFATGQHCWPYHVIIRQNGRLLLDELNAVRKLDRTALGPFSERIGFNSRVGSIEWQFADFLGKATAFFNSNTELSAAASRALWLLRSSGTKNLPGEITLISLCLLLESLAGMIYDELELASAQDSAAFEKARSKILALIKNIDSQEEIALKRFKRIVTSARLVRPSDKYQEVSIHLGLQWDGLMKDAWEIWEKVRHKGAHDSLRNEHSQKAPDHFKAVGRIAGAINLLVLKVIGYSGIARTSVFEDKHHNI